MKASRGWTLAALLAMAAAGPALAQSAAAGTSAGGSVGGSGATGTAATASGTGSAGTTGVVTGSGSGSASTATQVAPADGSNALAQQGSAPATPDAALTGRIVLPGAVVAQAGTSESAAGNTRTVVTHYWVNVPAGVERHAGFQRWQRLR